MEGHFISFLRALLGPANWLAGQIGLPDHLPAIELGVGLVFLASCFGLALLAFYHWLRVKTPLSFLAAVIALVGGIVGLLASVTFRHAWLYTLIGAIIAADFYWRLLTKGTLPRKIQHAGTLWALASLLLSAGTPTLFLIHTWVTEQKATSSLETTLETERSVLLTTEQDRLTKSVTTLSTSPEFANLEIGVGNPLLIATLQRLAVEERVSYLTLLGKSNVVLARTQPAAAFGDTWPVSIPGLDTGTTTGLSLSERAIPLVVSTHPLKIGDTSYTLVAGTQIDQSYLTTRIAGSAYPLFLLSSRGITALAASEGKALNALSGTSIDTFLAAHAGKAGTFTVASSGVRYLVRTLPLSNANGDVIVTMGAAYVDSETGIRLRFDLVAMIIVALAVICLPALLVRKRKTTEEEEV